VQTHPPGQDERHGDRGLDVALTALYSEHALRLIRLGYVMLGDRSAAEDVVQDAFAGLHRRWDHLDDAGRAEFYLRSSVLNGCRTVLRRRQPQPLELIDDRQLPAGASAEASALASEEARTVMSAVCGLPERQREVLVLRFYLDAPDAKIAALMGIRESTVRSTAHRALAALGRILGKQS
jgi:RNA polymerase sigma-70 factor (sigma-E family)